VATSDVSISAMSDGLTLMVERGVIVDKGSVLMSQGVGVVAQRESLVSHGLTSTVDSYPPSQSIIRSTDVSDLLACHPHHNHADPLAPRSASNCYGSGCSGSAGWWDSRTAVDCLVGLDVLALVLRTHAHGLTLQVRSTQTLPALGSIPARYLVTGAIVIHLA
jgi:hypothetical protein